jgi:hypothetical protein
MMQPTEDGLSPDFTSLGQSMPVHRSRPGQGLILIIMTWIIMTWPAKYLGPHTVESFADRWFGPTPITLITSPRIL